MPSSLGIYIEENLIKYAKVIKEKESIKVEAFNVVFYENNLAETLNKVISETYSFKVPICINVSNELYNYYDAFGMLPKKAIKQSIDIEFDMTCNEKKYNKSSLETRYILTTNKDDAEKLKALHIAVNKTDIAKKLQAFGNNKVVSMAPISTSITNVAEINPKENIAIINIENDTKITMIVEGEIAKISTIPFGMGQILESINRTENSMTKSYDVCKNVTIYTKETQTLQSEENDHLDDVMPTLYKIATESRQILDDSMANFSKIYITGLGTAINNIDLYFQEYMINSKCELLRPFFVEGSSVKISLKDYIEVNSAIALALDGLGYENKDLNFLTGRSIDFKQVFKKLTSGGANVDLSMSGPLDVIEKLLVRLSVATLMGVFMYSAFTTTTMKQIDNKQEEINSALTAARAQISRMDEDYTTIVNRTNAYTALIDAVNNLSESTEAADETRTVPKDGIPNLLNRIMFVIPQKVQITSIKNTQGSHIVIVAQSEKYEQLGYFKAVLDSKGILTNVKSTSGTKNGGVVKVTIEGELP